MTSYVLRATLSMDGWAQITLWSGSSMEISSGMKVFVITEIITKAWLMYNSAYMTYAIYI